MVSSILTKQSKYVFKYCVLLFFVISFFCLQEVVFASSGGEHVTNWVKEDTYRVFNFLVLSALCIFILKKPVVNSLNDRVENIRIKIEDLEIKKREVEIELDEYNKRLDKLSGETESILTEYVKQGEIVKDRILVDAKLTVEKLKEQSKKNIDHEFSKAKFGLQCEIVDKALARAEEMIKENINSDDQDVLIGEYLEKVVA